MSTEDHIHSGIDKAADAAHTATAKTAEGLEKAGEKISDTVEKISDKAEAAGEHIRDEAINVKNDFDSRWDRFNADMSAKRHSTWAVVGWMAAAGTVCYLIGRGGR